MAKLRALKSDGKKQQDGTWLEHPSGASFLVARAGNPKAESYGRQLKKPYMKQIRRGEMTDEQLAEIGRKVAARYILLDWRDIEDDDEENGLWPYTEENSLRIMLDPELRDVAEWVLDHASSSDNYQREVEDEGLKN
jgi:hypothetical protein